MMMLMVCSAVEVGGIRGRRWELCNTSGRIPCDVRDRKGTSVYNLTKTITWMTC